MSARDGTEVQAPAETVAWAASLGWLLDDDEEGLAAVRRRVNDVVLAIGADRWVRDLTGPAPLVAVVRIDRDLHELAMRLDRLCSALIDAAEQSTTR